MSTTTKLDKVMYKKGIINSELSRTVQVSDAVISKLRRGIKNVSVITALAIEKELRTPGLAKTLIHPSKTKIFEYSQVKVRFDQSQVFYLLKLRLN